MRIFLLLLVLLTAFPVAAEPFFGTINLGMGPEALKSQLGAPTRKGEKIEEMATGEWVEIWYYKNMEVSMASTSENGPQRVYRVHAKGPSPHKWLGVGIGTSYANAGVAMKKHKKADVPFQSTKDGMNLFWQKAWVVMTVNFKNGKVSEIFVGPGPE